MHEWIICKHEQWRRNSNKRVATAAIATGLSNSVHPSPTFVGLCIRGNSSGNGNSILSLGLFATIKNQTNLFAIVHLCVTSTSVAAYASFITSCLLLFYWLNIFVIGNSSLSHLPGSISTSLVTLSSLVEMESFQTSSHLCSFSLLVLVSIIFSQNCSCFHNVHCK